jgi:hypothetical protein
MKILTKLSATVTDGPWNEPYNVVSGVHVEPAPGQFGVIHLGAAGLTLRVGQAQAGIPLGEIIALLLPQLGAFPATPPPAAAKPAITTRAAADRIRSAVKKGAAAAAIGVVILGSVLLAHATSYMLAGGLVSVNNTTSNMAPITIGNFLPPQGLFYFQNGGLSTTQALKANIQLGIDGTNWLTVATYRPSGTNATNEAFSPSIVQSIFLRCQEVTTNNVQFGATAQF